MVVETTGSDQMAQQKQQVGMQGTRRMKIGLALSGGGFRASIFHLGVIRRLEELGIMKDVDVISTVSGGSIIGAYYVCEMQDRLRKCRSSQRPETIDALRLEIFEKIAEKFSEALDHNLRTRTMVFPPFYHPLQFLKSLWPGYSRSDVMQKEFDEFFFHNGATLDQLPVVEPLGAHEGEGKTQQPTDPTVRFRFGPKLVINTTSLLTGERRAFSREAVSGMFEVNKPNTNGLPLSRVVGASAGVPGLFPPTRISGDLLVDGGVSDNQGLDGLLKEGREFDGRREQSRADFDLIIVSDASGQFALLHRLKTKATAVLSRTFAIFQHELRNKMIYRLLAWLPGL